MDRKEALRILNLIGAASHRKMEQRYYALRAHIETLIEKAGTEDLREMYQESSRSLDEAYELLLQNKEPRLLTSGSVPLERTGEELEVMQKQVNELMSKMNASIAEFNQMRTYLQQYSALLEVQLAKADDVVKQGEAQISRWKDSSVVISELRETAERNVKTLAARLEEAGQIVSEMQKQSQTVHSLSADAGPKESALLKSGRLKTFLSNIKPIAPILLAVLLVDFLVLVFWK